MNALVKARRESFGWGTFSMLSAFVLIFLLFRFGELDASSEDRSDLAIAVIAICGTLGWFAVIAMVANYVRLYNVIVKLREARSEKAREDEEKERRRFRRVFTESKNGQIEVYVDGGGVVKNQRGEFTLDQREELQNCLRDAQHDASQHRERLLEADRLSATLNKTLEA